MDIDNLNKLDGDAVFQEILADKLEKNRKNYKQAMKNAVIRNDSAQVSASRQNKIAGKTQNKLNDLIDGGMAGFLTKEEEIDSDDDDDSGGELEETESATVTRRKRTFFRPSTYPQPRIRRKY
jgi:hypothetical protein